jgi:hypothetical protein
MVLTKLKVSWVRLVVGYMTSPPDASGRTDAFPARAPQSNILARQETIIQSLSLERVIPRRFAVTSRINLHAQYLRHGRRTKSRGQQALRREEVRRVHVGSPQPQPSDGLLTNLQREVLTGNRTRTLKSRPLLEPIRRICFVEGLAEGARRRKQGHRNQARLGQGLGSQGNGSSRRG